jgi:TetR/AcrR family transcriptional repressor of nem operon
VGHSRAEKALSRKRILAAAAARIRESGLDGISVGELMKSVNLTHGGFYGHFDSRADLIAAALEQAIADGQQTSFVHAGDPSTITVKSIVNSYLSPVHRDHPSTGCAFPILAGEVGRSDAKIRAIMADQLANAFELMSEALGEGGQDNEQFSISAWSMMIGAMMISRVLADDPLADQVLSLARKSVLELAELHGARKS